MMLSKRERSKPTKAPSSGRPRSASARRSPASSNAHKGAVEEENQEAPVLRLSQDLLLMCFLKLDSVFDINACNGVCRNWRETIKLDLIWKEFYMRWHNEQQLPLNATHWHDAFVKNVAAGRRILLEKIITDAVRNELIHTYEPPRFAYTPGVHFRALAKELQLRFYMSINGGRRFRISTRGEVSFPSSSILDCPEKCLKQIPKLSACKSFKFGVYSYKLASCYTFLETDLRTARWERIISGQPVRLLQCLPDHGIRVILGTLTDSSNQQRHRGEESNMEDEQILLLKVAVPLYPIVDLILRRGIKWGIQSARRRPSISIQLHTLDQLLWTKEFNLNQRMKGDEVIQQKCSLPWRCYAFSGEIKGTVMATITVWAFTAVWSCVKMVQLEPASENTSTFSKYEGKMFRCVIGDRPGEWLGVMEITILPEEESAFAITGLFLEELKDPNPRQHIFLS